MIKYVTRAAAFKLFSASPQTKRIYRLLGNKIGARKRVQRGLRKHRVDSAKKILELCERYEAIQEGDRLLEIGTGWVHWESTVIRLFYDVEISLFDIWNNRQFEACKKYFGQFEKLVDRELSMDPVQCERAHRLLRAISKTSSFDDLYHLLGFQYVINPKGTLDQFQDQSFAVIFSCNVLEHVDRDILPKFIRDVHRLLKPGGYSIHQIDLCDHLAYYDHSVFRKNYLRYSDEVWKRYFENKVQYFNRVQYSEWLDLFHEAGFEVVEEESISEDIGTIKVDKSYEDLNRQDLGCVWLGLVHRKSSD